MSKLLAVLALLLFAGFSAAASTGHPRAASGLLLAGFLVGAGASSTPSRAQREEARQRHQAAQDPQNMTRIF